MDTSFANPAAVQSAVTAYLTQVQTASPTAGQTVAAVGDDKSRIIYLTPAGTLATLTVSFPSDVSSRVGQTLTIGSTQAITALTLSGATIIGGVSSLLANSSVTYAKVASNTWIAV